MDLADIKNIGTVRIKRLNEAGIKTLLDLCCHFPYKYIDASLINNFEIFNKGDEVVAFGRVKKIEKKFIRANLRFTKVEFETNNGKEFFATWFNQPYINNIIKLGQEYLVIGKLNYKLGQVDLSAPSLKNIDCMGTVIPVYKGMGLTSAVFKEIVKNVLDSIKIDSFLPKAIQEKFGLMDTHQAFYAAHFPVSMQESDKARRSLSLENLAGYIALYSLNKQQNIKNKPHNYTESINFDILKKLPFKLTDDQLAAYKKIIASLRDVSPANILIEGDVGCGKTIVCLLAMYYAALSGHQSVLMCPTEILARQHYQTALTLFSDLNIEFLTGSMTGMQRSNAAFNIKVGNAKIIIGTHSVFTKDIEYQDLTLVITDEQHRFGVNQRGALENKSIAPDRIVLSATPIPRTLALTIYDELQLITIKQKPKQKAKVLTRFVDTKIDQMYKYILDKANSGEQAFIVCPRIDKIVEDEENENPLMSATELYKKLKPQFKESLGLLHGRMSETEKQSVMSAFIKGDIKVLVATTIVEVGIDIKNATTMVIYNAERYGLSQLHQLRGRIGRGEKDGYCFLLCSSKQFLERLRILESCDDGFTLAEQDFLIRGAGDFLGTRQHGKSITFTGEPISVPLLKQAKEIAKHITDKDLALFNLKNEENKSEIYFKQLALN